MKLFCRFHIALLLSVTYTLIIMSPLAPLAMRSAVVGHIISGKCSGDCATCGCSPERRANHTCCCWQRRLNLEHDTAQAQLPDCCKKKSHGGKTVVLRCGCPCGGNELPALPFADDFDLLPYNFSEGILGVNEDDLSASLHSDLLKGRHGDPPDPPPKLVILS